MILKPLLKILIVEPNIDLLRQFAENLISTATQFARQDVEIQVVECTATDTALECIENDGDIQAVILSWDIQDHTDEGGNYDKQHDQFAIIEQPSDLKAEVQSAAINNQTIEKIKAIRLELPVYVIGDDTKGLFIINESEHIESFFFRDEVISDPESILGYIINDFDDRCATPFWTAYQKYVAESNDSWHTPGHSGGTSFRHSPYINDFYQFYGRNVFVGDLSVSVDSLGSLSDSSHCIGKAQQIAASTFEVNHTYFVTNGSSTSNKIVLQTLLRKNDKVIVDRNCHKSVHYGILQSASAPIYLSSELDPKYGIFSPPSITEIKQVVADNPDAKLLVLTGCTYDGLLSDLKQIVDIAHAAKIKVFIDEAWFAYSLFHPQFRYYSAINSGADYVTHSAHKIVSAFSQSSYIHINDPDFDQDFFREIYNIHASTSPKYQLIASLDVCHKQLEMEGYKILHGLLKQVDDFKRQMSSLKNIKILGPEDFKLIFSHFETDNMGHDPLKILIDISGLNYGFSQVHKFLLDEVGLEIEKHTHSTILVLLTFGGTRSKIARLYNAIRKLDSGKVKLPRAKGESKMLSRLPPIKMVCLPNEAFFGEREAVHWSEAVGRVCAGLVTPYPPGIPLLVPGQLIEQQQIEYLSSLTKQNVTIQGSFDGEIYVQKEL